MKFQSLFSGKNKKNISECRLLKILSSMQSVKRNEYTFRRRQLSELFFFPSEKVSLGSYVGKPSSAYGWSGGFSPGSPVFAHHR